MLYSAYDSENAFRTAFVVPLLTRLGFLGVTDLHGVLEFGKDVVCTEITRFGTIRHIAAVLKHKDNITQGDNQALDEISNHRHRNPGTRRTKTRN